MRGSFWKWWHCVEFLFQIFLQLSRLSFSNFWIIIYYFSMTFWTSLTRQCINVWSVFNVRPSVYPLSPHTETDIEFRGCDSAIEVCCMLWWRVNLKCLGPRLTTCVNPLTWHKHVQVGHIPDAIVCQLSVVFVQHLHDLSPQSVLNLRMQRKFVESVTHCSGRRFERAY